MNKVIIGAIVLGTVGAMYFMNQGDNSRSIEKYSKKFTTHQSDNSNEIAKDNGTPTEEEKKIIAESFDNFKDLHPHFLSEMKKIPMCLGKANTKEEAEQCSIKLREVQVMLSVIVGELSAEDANSTLSSNESITIPTWNQKIKEKMIEDVEAVIPDAYRQDICVKKANNTIEVEKCFLN